MPLSRKDKFQNMPAFRQRTWVALLAILLGTAGGALAGYLLGRVITLQQAEARLEQLAARMIDEGQNATVESRKVLAAMNGSPYPMCSDAEVGLLSEAGFRIGLSEGSRTHAARPHRMFDKFREQYEADGSKLSTRHPPAGWDADVSEPALIRSERRAGSCDSARRFVYCVRRV